MKKSKTINVGDLVRRKYYNNSIQENEIGFVVEISPKDNEPNYYTVYCYVDWFHTSVTDIRGYACQDLVKVSK